MLRRSGYVIVDISRVLQERLGLPLLRSPATVTVKSIEERPDDILVFGYPWDHGVRVEETLIGELRYVAVRRSRYGNNTVVAARIESGPDGSCRVVLPDGRSARPKGDVCGMGEGVRLVTVLHDPPGRGMPVVVPEIRLVGYYTILSWPGEGVSYSEHIRGADLLAELLLAAEEVVDLKRFHVHFRSNSRHASEEQIRNELESLLGELEALLGNTPEETRVVRWGEYLSIIRVPRPAKDYLDTLRAEASPTVQLHHSLKTFGQRESMLVDCAEYASKQGSKPEPGDGRAIMAFLLENSPRRTVIIDHLRPDGQQFRLGPFRVESVVLSDGRVRARLVREFLSGGRYDGLDTEKRPGDRGVTIVDSESWITIHEYYRSDGRLIGVYANVNTPPEMGGGRIKYLDLIVDVVKRPGMPSEIIDVDELEELYKNGMVTEHLYKKALEEADRASRRLDSMY